jgi:ABC-type dipeptide/oligopeptide/nickel transport system permease subunit
MNYKTLNFSSWGEYLSSAYTFYTLFTVLVIMPILYIYLLGKKKEILEE